MNIVDSINEAIKGSIDITIKYQKYDGTVSTRKLSNVQYSEEYGDEYIQAFCQLRQEDRTFKISRILEVSSDWTPFGDKYPLKDVWEITNPGLYDEIEGDIAEVTTTEYDDGTISYRISIPFKDGSEVELKLTENSALEEGDKVNVHSIVCQEFHKIGNEPIVRYDGELLLSTEVTKEDLKNAWIDEYGVKYSSDKIRILRAPQKISNYRIRYGTKVICDCAFAECYELQSVIIPDSIEYIGKYAFEGCESMNSIDLPENVIYVGEDCFENCSCLTSIYIPFGSRNKFEDFLPGCKNELTEPNETKCKSAKVSNIDIGTAWTDEFGVKYSKDKKRLLVAPNNLKAYSIIEGTEIVCDWAFSGNKELTSVTFPEGILSIGDYAFFDCINLRNATLPNSVKSCGWCAFEGCELLPGYYPY